MKGRPEANEAAPYYFTYIDRIASDNILTALQAQLDETLPFLGAISEEKSLHRYAPEKWTIRQMWNHVNDTERIFLHRALWFARGFTSSLASFDQNVAVASAVADQIAWARHVAEFADVRRGTLDFFRNLPDEAWTRSGTASQKHVTVRALAYIIAGHVAHHVGILRERYL